MGFLSLRRVLEVGLRALLAVQPIFCTREVRKMPLQDKKNAARVNRTALLCVTGRVPAGRAYFSSFLARAAVASNIIGVPIMMDA